MIKKTLSYLDYDKNPQVDTLWFNVTESDMIDNLGTLEEFKDIQTIFTGESHDLSVPEIQTIFNYMKKLVRLSYGIRLDDGGFDKSDLIWKKFTEKASYNALLMDFFYHPEEANKFMQEIFPEALMASAQEQMKANPNLSIQDIKLPENPSTDTGLIKDLDKPKELKDMTREELLAAMKAKNDERLKPSTGTPTMD